MTSARAHPAAHQWILASGEGTISSWTSSPREAGGLLVNHKLIAKGEVV